MTFHGLSPAIVLTVAATDVWLYWDRRRLSDMLTSDELIYEIRIKMSVNSIRKDYGNAFWVLFILSMNIGYR